MALIKCPECKHEVSDKAASCPHCGFGISSNSKNGLSPQKDSTEPINQDEQGLKNWDRYERKGFQKPKGRIGCLGLLGIIIAFIIVIVVVSSITSNSNSSSGTSSETSSPQQEVVSNSSWDGSVRQVKEYLDKNLKDPESFKAIEWGPVRMITNNSGTSYVVRCKYRSKNGFGGYVIENQLFYLNSSGIVTLAIDQP